MVNAVAWFYSQGFHDRLSRHESSGARDETVRDARGMAIKDSTQPLLHTFCSYCDRYLYSTPCVPEMSGRMSHGLCKSAECNARARS